MILKDWLKLNSIKPYVFAKSMGMAPATIYRNLAGKQRMSARFAVKVEAETNGQVSRTEAVWPEAFSWAGLTDRSCMARSIHQKDEEGSSTPIQF